MGANIYKNKKPLLFFLLPAFAFMILFLFYPFIQNIIDSFMKIKQVGSSGTEWNDPWYQNYVKLFTDPVVRIALKNTMIMLGVTLIGQVGIAIVLAIMVDNIRAGAKLFRTIYFFPIVISATALGLLFNLMFLYDKGMLNQVLDSLGGTGLINWKEGKLSLFTLMIPVMWQYVGFYFVILITGLNNISEDLYEVASIDGATRLQRIRYITLPMMHNVICTCVVLAVTGALKVFDLPWVMFPNGVPSKSTFLTGTYMYFVTNQAKDVDYGATLAIMIVILGIVLSKLVNVVFKEKDY